MTDPKQGAVPTDEATDEAINALSFEQALDQLTQLVERLESGQLSLEDSVNAFETGVKLSRRCEALLDSAEQRLQILNDAAAE